MNKFHNLLQCIPRLKNYFFIVFYHPHFRKIIASFLFMLGGTQLWLNYSQGETAVLIARTTLYPGVAIVPTMVETRKFPTHLLPKTVVTDAYSLENKYVMAPISPGELIFHSQLLDHIQAEQYLPAETHPRIVPITLHDPAIVRVMKPGQIVDIISKNSDSAIQKHGEILAQNAVIITVFPAEQDRQEKESLIYLALTQSDAQKTAENPAEFGFIFH